MQYCHLVKGFRHSLKQLVDISNMLCKLVLVEVTFRFNLRFKQLLFQLISQAYLSCGLTYGLLKKCTLQFALPYFCYWIKYFDKIRFACCR